MVIFLVDCPTSQNAQVVIAEDISDTDVLTEAQENAISTYLAYFIVKTHLDIIYNCYQLSISSRKYEIDNEAARKTAVQARYQSAVIDKLLEAKQYMLKLMPLLLRVEVLENIFSLLFLTRKDVIEMDNFNECDLSGARIVDVMPTTSELTTAEDKNTEARTENIEMESEDIVVCYMHVQCLCLNPEALLFYRNYVVVTYLI